MPTELYIVRHGEVLEAGEPPRLFGAGSDPVLTLAGVAQAEALGRHFAAGGVAFTRALAGPRRRTRRTAEMILWECGSPIPLEPTHVLDEIDYGDEDGLPEADVALRLGGTVLEGWLSAGVAPEDWSIGAELRAADWREFAASAGDGAILMVTSGEVARLALGAFGLAPEGGPLLAPGAYGRIVVDGDAPVLAGWNRTP